MTKMREMIISSQDFFCFYFYFSLLHFSPPKLWKSIKKIYFPPHLPREAPWITICQNEARHPVLYPGWP